MTLQKVKYIGIQKTQILNIKPWIMVNDDTGSTVKFDPILHELSVGDLHILKQDIKELPDSELVKLITCK